MTDNTQKSCFIILAVIWCIKKRNYSDDIVWLLLHNAHVDESHVLLKGQQCQQCQCVCVTPRGSEPAHTDTAMCSDGLTQRWEQLSERVLCCCQRKTDMGHRITCFEFFSVSATCQVWNGFRLASRWHCNLKAESSVLVLLYDSRS